MKIIAVQELKNRKHQKDDTVLVLTEVMYRELSVYLESTGNDNTDLHNAPDFKMKVLLSSNV